MPRSLSRAIFVTLFAVLSAAAQSPDASSPPAPSQSQDSAQPAGTRKPKKVWTNENLSGANGAVSVVGDPKNASNNKPPAGQPVNSQYIATVRKQLEKLQAQMADADKQITDLTNFSKGDPSPSSGSIQLRMRYNDEPIDAQIRALQQKRKDLQAKIDALVDEARKRGVEPGQLR